MNAIALMLCAVIAGADARETIPDSHKLYEIINKTYEIDQIPGLAVAPDGDSLQGAEMEEFKTAEGETTKFPLVQFHRRGRPQPECLIGEFTLTVVSSEDHPNFLLAGYVRSSEFDSLVAKIHANPSELSPEWLPLFLFCVLLDTDRNIVIPLDNPNQRLFLSGKQATELGGQMGGMWRDYLKQFDKQQNNSAFYQDYKELSRQFISPPDFGFMASAGFNIQQDKGGSQGYATPNSSRAPNINANITVHLRIYCDEREVRYDGPALMQELLSSKLAIAAKEYFANPPIQAVTLPSPR